MKVVAYVPDLMDRSKVSAAAPGVMFVRTAEELVDAAVDADVVVIDLARPGVLDGIAELSGRGAARIVGFGSHVDRDLLDRARAAGCHDVLPRSAFFSRMSELLA